MDLLDEHELRSDLADKGWAFISSPIDNEIPESIRGLGPVIPPMRGNEEYRDLIPYKAASAPLGSMSSITGTGEQPMHTDGAFLPLPPRFIVLQCLNTGESPCPTHLWIVDHGTILRDRPRPLADPHWVFQGGGHSPFYSSIVEVRGTEMRARFDPFCMRPSCALQPSGRRNRR